MKFDADTLNDFCIRGLKLGFWQSDAMRTLLILGQNERIETITTPALSRRLAEALSWPLRRAGATVGSLARAEFLPSKPGRPRVILLGDLVRDYETHWQLIASRRYENILRTHGYGRSEDKRRLPS